MRTAAAVACLALLAACSDPPAAGAAAHGTTPPAAQHDFGTIPHGESRRHDFVLDTRPYGRCVPLRVQLDCSCARGQLLLRGADGSERLLDGSPLPANAPADGELLVVRVVLDTITKDPVDLPPTHSRGHVLLQPVHDRDGSLRIHWPLVLTFGIETPVVLQPFAALDFGAVATSARPEIVTTLAGDAAHAGARFGPAACTDPAIDVVLEQQDGKTLVRARCTPGELGNHRAVVRIDTDLAAGYRVHLGVTWKVVPDLQATPLPKLSFRTALLREQDPAAARGQFLIVTDHDERRSPEFAVHEIVGDDGRDARSSFAVTFEPVPGQRRQLRLFVRYLGGQPHGFRGRLVLTKDGGLGPFLPIELVVFAAKDS